MAAAVGGSVIAVDLQDDKLELAKKFGATATVNPKNVEKLSKEVRKMTGGGADHAIECIGNPKTMEQAFDCLRIGGRFTMVGYSDKPMSLNAARVQYREMEVIGSLGCGMVDYPKCIEMVRIGKIQVVPMVTARFSLDQINEAYDTLRRGEGVRSIIVF